jgi:hypothetical protein
MLAEAVRQADADTLFRADLNPSRRAPALRAVHRFLAPLGMAAAAATSVEEIEKYRAALSAIVKAIDIEAARLENTYQIEQKER